MMPKDEPLSYDELAEISRRYNTTVFYGSWKVLTPVKRMDKIEVQQSEVSGSFRFVKPLRTTDKIPRFIDDERIYVAIDNTKIFEIICEPLEPTRVKVTPLPPKELTIAQIESMLGFKVRVVG